MTETWLTGLTLRWSEKPSHPGKLKIQPQFTLYQKEAVEVVWPPSFGDLWDMMPWEGTVQCTKKMMEGLHKKKKDDVKNDQFLRVFSGILRIKF